MTISTALMRAPSRSVSATRTRSPSPRPAATVRSSTVARRADRGQLGSELAGQRVREREVLEHQQGREGDGSPPPAPGTRPACTARRARPAPSPRAPRRRRRRSRPARSHSTSSSQMLSFVTAIIVLSASFMSAPLPTSPRWCWARVMAASAGRTCSRSSAEPPTSAVSVPARAERDAARDGRVEEAHAALGCGARELALGVGPARPHVDEHGARVPSPRAPRRRRRGPRGRRRASGSRRRRRPRRRPGRSRRARPRRRTTRCCRRERFQTDSSRPALARFCAIGSPMRPSPRNATFMRPRPRRACHSHCRRPAARGRAGRSA